MEVYQLLRRGEVRNNVSTISFPCPVRKRSHLNRSTAWKLPLACRSSGNRDYRKINYISPSAQDQLNNCGPSRQARTSPLSVEIVRLLYALRLAVNNLSRVISNVECAESLVNLACLVSPHLYPPPTARYKL